ncbi:unnamed protein product [Brassica oleracea]
MWGKGKKLEIHNNPLNRSTLVRIPSEYLRQKILEKCIWYVGDSMFHTVQWTSEHSMSTPPLKAIRIWAHLTGVPLDLRYNAGLSLVAGLIGDPKETDEFAKNLVSLTVSHVKVEVDVTKPLPDVVEFQRQSGEVVEVQTPPVPLTLLPTPPPGKNPSLLGFMTKPLSPDIPRPSLKRSRSSPTFPPTLALNKPPFVPLPSDHVQTLFIKLFFWNLRGLNDPGKHRTFVNWLFNHRPLFGALLESHVKELSLLSLMNNICSGWNYVSNHASDDDGRVIFIWKDPLNLQVIHQSRQSLTCILTIPNKDPIYYSAVYASNLAEDRLELWAELIHLHSTFDLQNKAWFVGGDFNQIVHASEHSSDAVVSQDHQMYMMQDCLL